MRSIIFIVLFLMLILSACTDESDDIIIDAELQEYFDQFAEEGKARGVTVDYNLVLISARVTNINDRFVAGTCARDSDDVNDIEISRAFWNRVDEFQREYVMFHELGHCYLNREHLETQHSDGTCVSIMASGTGSCSTDYSIETRREYLDELFR